MSFISEKLFSLIAKCNRDPFCILGKRGEIIFSNQHCKNLIKLKDESDKITDYFAPESAYNFDLLLDAAVEKNDVFRSGHYILKLKNGGELKTEIILNPFEDEGNLYIMCTIIPRFFAFEITGESKFSIETGDVSSIIKDPNVNEILIQLSKLYPLTFIGKEILRKRINSIDEYFWLKDKEGNFLIANNLYTASLGLDSNQVEGKIFENYIPAYMINFYSAINNYITDTHNCVIVNGIPLKGFIENVERELMIIPLTDNDNEIVAQAGVTRKRAFSDKEEKSTELFEVLFDLIDFFPKPVAFVDSDGIFRHVSNSFNKLFAGKFIEIKNIKYSEVFNPDLVEIVSNFVKSNKDGIVIDINEKLELNGLSEPDSKLFLTKYYRKENLPAGFSVYFEKIEYFDTLQKLITSKGRMFEILIKNNPSPIFIYDKENLRFLEVNDAALKLYGYGKDEFLQMDLTDLYSPEDIQSLLGTSEEKFEEGVYGTPLKHKKKDGSTVLVEMSKIEFKFNDRDAHFNIINDITEKNELDKKIQLFKAAFDNTNNLIFITDREGIISFANDAAAKMLMIEKSELQNSSLTSFCVDEDRALLNTSVFQSHLKDNTTLEIKLKRSNGSEFDTLLTSVPVLDANFEVETFSIIAVPKVSETLTSEPKEIIKEVIKEVVVEKNVDSQASGNEQKLDPGFLSSVFHEILTPMNVILGFAQELTEGAQNVTQEQKEAADIINQNRFTLLSTMNSIVEFSDILFKRSGVEVKEIGITEIIENLDKNIKEISGSENIDFSYGKISSSLRFTSDKMMFESLIGNLIRLIGKITKQDKIYFSAYPLGEESFLISISDKYGTTSESLENTLRQLFVESKDPKDLGISKLTTQISKTLLSSINGEYVSFTNSSGRIESGFKFPVNFERTKSTSEDKQEIESVPQKDVESIEPTQIIDEIPEEKEEIEMEADAQEEISPVQDPLPEIQEESIAPEIELQENKEEELAEELVEEDVKEELTDPVEEINFSSDEEITEEEVDLSIESHEPSESFKEKQEFIKSELDLSSLKCLYIEDQVDSQILFKVQMKGLAEIKFAASFEEAKPLLDSNKFDFIVMDINLQGEYNGLDALKIIHKMPGFENIPIIAVTAYVLPGDKEKFIATGFNDFISKPIFREKMVESLNKIFVTH